MDLTVSIAFVGGVDPETGQSTRETTRSYRAMHCRDAQTQQCARGWQFRLHQKAHWPNTPCIWVRLLCDKRVETEIPIIPVHSSQRGKLYLPFVDEDPKTVEIVSKVVLLAEDNKLKDPTILQWIERQ